MRVHDAGRFFAIFALVAVVFATAASCGGSGAANNFSGDASIDDGSPGILFSQDSSVATGSTCTPKSCSDQGFNCGLNGDTCGGQIDCGNCSGTDKCGYGGFSQCGSPFVSADGGVLCTPKTCADWGYDCGPAGDGCGNMLDCGPTACTGNEFCGGGGPGKCGGDLTKTADGGPVCTPKTCADWGYNCGSAGDGCGGTVGPCGTCTNPQYCGGGGVNVCGGDNGHTPDGGSTVSCSPKTCAMLGATCGTLGNGCGGTTGSCGTCANPAFCGGGGANKCGGNNGLGTDGGVVCTPKTCANYGAGACGQQSDGCGGLTANCGTCTNPQFCGGGGPGKCGGNNDRGSDGGLVFSCTKKTCASFATGTCGQQSDGCGGLTASCATCTNPQFCGGGGPGLCGGNNLIGADGGAVSLCKPATCASLGYTCGKAGDGCGGTIDCGPTSVCIAPQACGATAGKPNVCGSDATCTGLCTQLPTCPVGTTNSLKGTVVAGTPSTYLPAGVAHGDPVPNVLVYIPNGPVSAFTSRASETAAQQCSTCGADVSGNPLVETTTAFDGTFTLKNVPVGNNIPIVIQLGRWRRQFTVNVTSACGSNTLAASGTSNGAPIPTGYLVMPNTQAEGDIPLTAISTGNVDAMECVLLKMGVDPSEFTQSSGTGRVHMYLGNGANAGTGTPNEAALMETGGTYNNYDQIILPCWGNDPGTTSTNRFGVTTWTGSANWKTATELADLGTYASNGGHFFATHFNYLWLTQPWSTPNNGPFVATANWDVDANGNIASTTGTVSQSVPPTTPATTPGTFVLWLNYISALSNSSGTSTPPNPAQVALTTVRHDVDSVAGQSTEWIQGTDQKTNDMLLHFTFNTPVGSASQCGHGIFSDFHVNDAKTNGTDFTDATQRATECGTTPLTTQEKILEYSIWDLASCVPGTPVSKCTPKTCTDFPGSCGQQGDGCGGLTAVCGVCTAPATCGGSGVPNVCGAPDGGACTPKTCASFPTGTCGAQSDGCGGLTANCANCAPGQSCGGGGTAGVCGAPDAGTCVPLTCAAYPSNCGAQSNGCGGLTAACNPCTAPATCGGGGTPGVCGTPEGGSCTALTCAAYPGICGQQSNGCGALTPDCNPCPAGQSCGGGGTPGQCGAPPSGSCVPLMCPAQNINCGPAGDGCGNVIASCGTCTPPASCGGGGIPGQCGGMSTCNPLTCAAQNITCGPAGDGCGNLIQGGCGTCVPPGTCGGGGVSGQCGGGNGCIPKTCQDLGFTCGPAGDGCGGLIPTCGTCTGAETCGGGGVAGQCGMPIQK